jgi:hypothetical protein
MIIIIWLLLSALVLSAICAIGVFMTNKKLSNPCKCGGKYEYWCSSFSNFDAMFKCNKCGRIFCTSYALGKHFDEDKK